jgi:hypothetical protein
MAPHLNTNPKNIMSTITAKDLTKEAPASPRIRIGGYVILGRTADKCRALLGGNIGDYHFDCPLDNILFGFKEVKGDDFKAEVEKGASNEALAQWLDSHGTPKTPEEIKAWGDAVEGYSLVNDPEKKDYFIAECTKLGLDPYKTTLFDWLEADDKASF